MRYTDTQVKSYPKPPATVERVMSVIMILMLKETSWQSAKKVDQFALVVIVVVVMKAKVSECYLVKMLICYFLRVWDHKVHSVFCEISSESRQEINCVFNHFRLVA